METTDYQTIRHKSGYSNTYICGTQIAYLTTSQRELSISRLLTLRKMVGWSATPAIVDIHAALTLGLDDLNALIDGELTRRFDNGKRIIII